MAITAQLARVTQYSLAYLLTHDGAAGDALVIPNSTLVADATEGGPIADLVASDITAASDAAARELFGGYNALDTVLTGHPLYAELSIQPLNAQNVAWSIDSAADAVTTTRCELNVSKVGEAGSALLKIQVRHTLDR